MFAPKWLQFVASEWHAIPTIYFNKKKKAGYRTGTSIIGCYLGNNVILARVLSTVHVGAVRSHVTVPWKIFINQFPCATSCISDVSHTEKMHRLRPEFLEPWNWNKEQIAMILYPAKARMMKDLSTNVISTWDVSKFRWNRHLHFYKYRNGK